MYIKSNDKYCQKIMHGLINSGLSKIYNRPVFFEGFDPYGNSFTTLFLNKICCVYFPMANEYKNLSPEIFDKLLKIYRNSEYAMKAEDEKSKNHGIKVDNYGDADTLDALINALSVDNTARDYSSALLKELFHDALDTLSATQREIIIGLYYNNKTQAELAEELGCTQSTISYQKDRAIELITQYFKDHGYEAEDFEL